MASQKLFNQEQINKIRTSILNKAKDLAPHHLANYIDAKVTSRKDGWSVRWMVPVDPEGPTADARAQEYGSGEHATKGQKKKILIVPKKKRALAFEWQTADRDLLNQHRINFWVKRKQMLEDPEAGDFNFVKGPMNLPSFMGESKRGDNKLLFNWVMHPGIPPYKGKGYLGAALAWSAETTRSYLAKEGAAGLGRWIRQNWTFNKKK